MNIFENARGYHSAALRCNEKRANKDGSVEWLPIHATAIAAFACELYLKAILSSKGIHAKGHGLLELFELLPKQTREIIGEIDTVKLDTVSQTFIKWRYLHENITGNFHDENVFVCELMENLFHIAKPYFTK